MNIADRIQDLRKAKGISQEELADKIGVSRQAVSKWESEQSTPDIDKVILLSDYFETTTDYLLKGIEPVRKEDKKWSAMIFFVCATLLNIIGLISSVVVWIERQEVYATGIGIILMLIGTGIFLIGQFTNRPEKEKAQRLFIQLNIWILLFVPLSFIWNIFDGLVFGYSGQLAPIPLLGNSLITFVLFWAIYIIICIIVDVLVQKNMLKK